MYVLHKDIAVKIKYNTNLQKKQIKY